MQIQVDSREKQRAIAGILDDFDRYGIKYFSSKLYVGDYMNLDNPRLVIDRKQNLLELYQNLCQGKQRFYGELERAKQNGIKMVILCEHGGKIKSLDDVAEWQNPRLNNNPYAWDGVKLRKELMICASTFDVDLQFCDKRTTGRRIIEILSGVRV